MFYAEARWATYLKASTFIEWKRKDKRRIEKGQSRRKGRKGREKRATGWRQKSHPRLGKSALIMTRCRESVSPGGMAGSGSMTLLDQLDSQRDKQTLFHYSECWMYSIILHVFPSVLQKNHSWGKSELIKKSSKRSNPVKEARGNTEQSIVWSLGMVKWESKTQRRQTDQEVDRQSDWWWLMLYYPWVMAQLGENTRNK